MEPTGALNASSKQVLSVALLGTSIYIMQGLYSLLGPWMSARRKMILENDTDVRPV